MPNEEKDKKCLHHEREKVMVQGIICGSIKRQLHKFLVKLSNIQINWVECKLHAQANVSINICFSKHRRSLCDIILET